MPPEVPVALSAVGLRLVGEVGQTALNDLAFADASALAEFDQHVAAVRAELAACQHPFLASAQRAGIAAWRPARSGRPLPGGTGQPAGTGQLGATGQPMAVGEDARSRSATASPAPGPGSCPDVPFVASALCAEPVPPLRLLLHYACGFVEAAVSGDWWPADLALAPGESTVAASVPGELPLSGIDWPSMRMAAICDLVSTAEAAAELPPDLHTLTEGHGP